MYSITTTVLDGHNGLGTPDTCLVKKKKDVIKELKEWAANNSYDDDAESVLHEIEHWDGKETLDFRNGDGEGIVVQHHS